MMKPNKIRILLSMLVFSLAVFSAGCGAFSAPTPTPATDPFTTFQSPDGLFSLSVPVEWTRTNNKSTDGTLNEYKFIAPDKNGVIQVVVATRDQPVSDEIANAFTARLLRSFTVETDTVNILGDKTTPEGRRVLTWHAKQGLMGGVAMVEKPGTNLIVVVVSSPDSSTAKYQPLFDRALSSYKAK